ncbi:HAD family hydrolase [Sporosarcina sp. P26b]|uniref:D-glycero-alpha-D-manno-heptose-1,7-bisphosphate 7-phosphatase n=1 Tax=Sporosarcina TaxID=1569 RepID=UPI000A17D28A|nr:MULTISPECIES: HAD family hydrolase [Sporosarcina]ARK20681.1 D-glycero-beta-D-manno-heptose-1,7-bisphosphate 7-phosphatase [Sporosarcina ureae]PIC74876.1 HAD family hydrolase [Sporosarcina sp. P17b]PIC97482.1 HAD family hydrolase [Sporosarcina sp. P26b]
MKKAVFLDRDGVINEVLTSRVKFVNEPNQLYFLPGVPEAIKRLNEVFDYIFVVTNQGGVGLGYMKESKLQAIHTHMQSELAKEDAHIQEVAYCPHKPKSGCDCRKPNSKLIVDLAEKYQVDLSSSYMVGDTDTDIMAGKHAGTKTVFLGTADPLADAVFPNLLQATPWIIDNIER